MSKKTEKTKKNENLMKIKDILSKLDSKQVNVNIEKPKIDLSEFDQHIQQAQKIAEQASKSEQSSEIAADLSDVEKRERQAKLMAERLKQRKMAV